MKRVISNCIATITLLFALSILAQAQGKFVYSNNDRSGNNSVSGFKVLGDGRLELLPGMPVGTDGGGGSTDGFGYGNDKVKATTKGPYLFAVSEGDQEVASFHIDPATGALKFIGTINLGDDGNDSFMAIAITPDENFMYVANPNNHSIHVLAINNDGTLTQIDTESVGDDFRPLDMSISPNQKFLAVSLFEGNLDQNGKLAMFAIAGNGTLSPAPGSPFNASGAGRVGDNLFNCASDRLYIGKNFTNKVSVDVFAVAANGSISQINASPFVFNIDGQGGGLAMSPNGKLLFISNGFTSVAVAHIGAGGGLTLGLFSPFPGTSDQGSISSLQVNSTGTFLFASHTHQRVETFKINADGTLMLVDGSIAGTNEDSDPDHSRLDSIVAFPLPKKCQMIAADDITVNNNPGVCGANVNYGTPTTCGQGCGKVTCDPPSGSFFDVGTHTVTCSSDGADDVSFKITVKDVEPPTIFQQPNIVTPTDANKCSAVIAFIATASDNCSNATVEVDHPSGSEFSKGVTMVHIKATDMSGNESNYSFTITVVDQQAPSIICPGNISVNNEPNKCGSVVNYPAPSVSDNCPGVGAPTCNPPSGTFFPVGNTMVACSVKDSSNNMGQCAFTINVKDVQPPTIMCPGNVTVVTPNPCDVGTVVNYPAPTVSDNCPNGLVVVCNPPSGSMFPIGTTMVVCTVTDGGGNQAQCGFNITVFDVRLQDDSTPNNVLLFNSVTGEYRLCSPSLPQPLTGTGTITKKACVSTLEHYGPDRKLLAKVDPAAKKGTATLQMPVGVVKVSITDKDISNNTMICQ